MERKTIDIYVPFNDKGELKQKCFSIGFISNRMNREYIAIEVKIAEAVELATELTQIKDDISRTIIGKERLQERREKYKNLEEKKEKVEAKLKAIGESDFFKKRVDLAVSILKANGVDDEKVMTEEFWDEKVEPSDFVEFLRSAITKDYTEKKKTQ